jgi:hypothetical protein
MTALPMAIAALLAATPLAAQDATPPPAPAPASNGVVGPTELRDFNLKGTVTPTAPVLQTTPLPQQALPPATRTAPPPAASAPATTNPAVPASEPDTRSPAAAEPTATKPASSVTFSLPSPDSATPETGAETDTPANLGSQPGVVPVEPPASASIPVDSGPSFWPWLLAALAVGVAVVVFGMRQRSRQLATAGGPMDFGTTEREPPARPLQRAASPPPAPRPAAAPTPPMRPTAVPPPSATVSTTMPGMIVSTRLRPQLDIQFMPERLIVESDRVSIQFAAIVLNSGNAPARDVLVEATMFNAGATQDEEIAGFFAHPVARGERIPEIPPLKTLTLRSAVTLPFAQIRVYEVEGRKLFVPLVGFNALYRWGGKDAQTSESFIVGIDTQAERMAPFRLDGTPRQFRNLGARAHTVRVRK